jgi:hypothetical protein
MRSSIFARAILAGFVVSLGALAIWLWNTRPALAAGASQNDKVCICTGPLDDNGEVTFVLDSLTGDLKAFSMHQSGKYSASYYRNILADFGLDKAKTTPQFSMVTGKERFPRRGTVTPAESVLHVAEATSGKLIAYTLPWSPTIRQKWTDPSKPVAQITLLDGVPFRGNIVRTPVAE